MGDTSRGRIARGGGSRDAHSRCLIPRFASQSVRPTDKLTPEQRELRAALDEEAEAEAMADDSKCAR